MTKADLILDRYEPLGKAGEGGFGTVQIAWDPRIQRKVAIKTIRLTALDAFRAQLPGAQATPLSGAQAARASEARDAYERENGSVDGSGADDPLHGFDVLVGGAQDDDETARPQQVTALAHLPGLDEARTAAMLSDPHIVTVFDFEVRDRTAYLIMEYVEGITLTRLLAEYGSYLTLDMAAAVFDAVAGALEVAHGAGVLHLDIKPDNILINSQGQVKVTDFGLATLADASGMGTTGGGTIGYMPLEQIRREHLDARADEWSLAAVAYEMLVGDNPFRVQGLDAAASAIEEAELVLPSLCWNSLDEEADDVLFYALDTNRDERYATVADFAEEMGKFLGDPEAGAKQLSLVVADALGMPLDGSSDDAGEPGGGVALEEGEQSPHRSKLSQKLSVLFGGAAQDAAGGPKALEAGSPDQGDCADDAQMDELVDQHIPDGRGDTEKLKPGRTVSRGVLVLGRVYAAIASGLLAFLSMVNMSTLLTAFGPGAQFVIMVVVAVVAVLAIIFPHVGALLAFCLLGVALVVCGHPIVGALLLIASVAWWYLVGHEGMAAANVALSAPLLGAVGGSSAVPLLAGSALRPLQAIGTTAFALVVTFVLGGLGQGTLLGWSAWAHWDFLNADITRTVLVMARQTGTWTLVAGWLAAAIAGSLANLRGGLVLPLLGIAVGLVAILLGGLAFSAPTPQLIVSTVLACALLIVAKVRYR